MEKDPLHDDQVESARAAVRQAAAWRREPPSQVLEAQYRLRRYLQRIERSGFDRDCFEALLESWSVIDRWLTAG
jgi:hypothetical protein